MSDKDFYEYDSSFAGQVNASTSLTFQTDGKHPLIADRVFKTFEAASMYAAHGLEEGTAVPGLILSVHDDPSKRYGDSSLNMNGVYQIDEDYKLKKLGSIDELNNYIEDLEVYRNLHFDRGLTEHRGTDASNYFGVTADASTILTNNEIEVIGVTVGNYDHMDIIPADTSVEGILRRMLTRKIDVSLYAPTNSMKVVNVDTSTTIATNTYYEVGTWLHYNIDASFIDGYFTSEDKKYYTDASFNVRNNVNNGIVKGLCDLYDIDYYRNGSQQGLSSDYIDVSNGDYNLSAKLYYRRSASMPRVNLKVSDKSTLGQPSERYIPQGTTDTSTVSIHGRYKYFFGYINKTSYDQLTSSDIRGLNAKTGWCNVTGETVVSSGDVTSNGYSVVMAVPSGYEFSQILDKMTGASYLPNFTSRGTVSVSIAGGKSNNYNVYVYPITTGAKVGFTNIKIRKS